MHSPLGVSVTIDVGLLLALTLPASAATIRVPADVPTIRDGIAAAAAGDTVLIDCGTYHEHDVLLKGGVVVRSETGDPSCVTVDGDEVSRVFLGEDLTAGVALWGLTVRGGLAEAGGAIRISRSPSLAVRECELSGNRATWGGGVSGYRTNVLLEDCVVRDNHAVWGAGIRVLEGTLAVRRSEMQGNIADALFGAGGGINAAAPLTISDSRLAGNVARQGGGVFSSDTLSVERCQFEENTASWRGGALGSSSTVDVFECSFLHNAADSGGAVSLEASTRVASVRGCTFEQNYAGHAAAVFVSGRSAETLVEGCVVASNVSRGFGSALIVQAAPVRIRGCTIVHNRDDALGATILVRQDHWGGPGAAVALERSLLAFNNAPPVWCWPGMTATASCTDIFGHPGGDWVGECLAPFEGVNGNFSADPLFCNAAAGVYTLNAGSPCLPAGNSCGELIGALGQGCSTVGVRPTSWSRVKAAYR